MLPAIRFPLQPILSAVAIKSIGSLYRIHDDWEVSPTVRKATLRRESILLGLTTLFSIGLQSAFPSFLKTLPHLAKHELALRTLLSFPALFLAEWVSRCIAPKKPFPASALIRTLTPAFQGGDLSSYPPSGYYQASTLLPTPRHYIA